VTRSLRSGCRACECSSIDARAVTYSDQRGRHDDHGCNRHIRNGRRARPRSRRGHVALVTGVGLELCSTTATPRAPPSSSDGHLGRRRRQSRMPRKGGRVARFPAWPASRDLSEANRRRRRPAKRAKGAVVASGRVMASAAMRAAIAGESPAPASSTQRGEGGSYSRSAVSRLEGRCSSAAIDAQLAISGLMRVRHAL
jgi:hypothetical protein